jgi:uncharacterized NAD(P)/FAD-binding protein YdhS
MVRSGLTRTDPLGLGLDATLEGQVVDGQGSPSPGLYVVGPLLRGLRWESVAIPEIRVQAAQVAQALLHWL